MFNGTEVDYSPDKNEESIYHWAKNVFPRIEKTIKDTVSLIAPYLVDFIEVNLEKDKLYLQLYNKKVKPIRVKNDYAVNEYAFLLIDSKYNIDTSSNTDAMKEFGDMINTIAVIRGEKNVARMLITWAFTDTMDEALGMDDFGMPKFTLN